MGGNTVTSYLPSAAAAEAGRDPAAPTLVVPAAVITGRSPEAVADAIEHCLDMEGIDGITLRQHHSFDTVPDFVELVPPILRERGRLPEREGALRRRLSGSNRLPAEQPTAQFRGAFTDHGV